MQGEIFFSKCVIISEVPGNLYLCLHSIKQISSNCTLSMSTDNLTYCDGEIPSDLNSELTAVPV